MRESARKLRELAKHDPEVKMYMDLYSNGDLNYREALEKCILRLARSKQYFLNKSVAKIETEGALKDG